MCQRFENRNFLYFSVFFCFRTRLKRENYNFDLISVFVCVYIEIHKIYLCVVKKKTIYNLSMNHGLPSLVRRFV